MPIVDIKKMEEEAKKKEKDINQIETKRVGETTYFKGPILDDWFTVYDECVAANTDAARLARFKKEGRDEFGRSKDDVRVADEKAKLVKEKTELLKKIAEIDRAIGLLNQKKMPDFLKDQIDREEQEKLEASKKQKKDSKKK